MTPDKEIEAMSQITASFEGLDADTIGRILRWAADRYGVSFTAAAKKPMARLGSNAVMSDNDELQFSDLGSLFEQANPQSASENALIAGYWFQVVKQEDDLDSQKLNTELKQLGHGSTNITRDLNSLIDPKPSLVIQIRKSGSTKQARKKYRLTAEGIAKVKRMLSGEATSQE